MCIQFLFTYVFFRFTISVCRLLVELLTERDRRKQLREALEKQILQEKEDLKNEQQRKVYEQQVRMITLEVK